MTVPEQSFLVEVAEGRSVEVMTAGPQAGFPLVFHTGTPAGLVSFRPMIEAAASHGMRLVCYSRHGYGRSDPRPGRLVADAAADVTAILDHLGADCFVTAGWSGGGPHALACAALLPGRCLAAASIAGVAPYSADGLDWLAGMAAENVAEFTAAMTGEPELTAWLAAAAGGLADVTGEQIAAAFGELVTEVDRAALTGEFADYMAAATRAAVSAGIAGWRDDDLAFVAHWGFDLDAAGGRVPLSIWQGDQDAMVPFAHGQWLASRLPGARAHLLPGEGHLSITATALGAVFAELAELAGFRPAPSRHT